MGDSADPVNITTLPSLGANPTIPAVDVFGNPLSPEFWPDSSASSPRPYTGRLICFSVFGNAKLDGSSFGPSDCPSGTDIAGRAYTGVAMLPSSGDLWDPKRPTAAASQSGYFSKILDRMPRANDFFTDNMGDGLNYANFRWLLTRGGNNTNEGIAGSEAFTDRKQINLKIDHNFTANHKVNASWTYQLDDNVDNAADWPNGLHGSTYRRPQTLTLSGTSTLSGNLLNEARFGMNYNKTNSVPAWLNPNESIRNDAESFLLTGGPSRSGKWAAYPVVVAPSTGAMTLQPGSNGDLRPECLPRGARCRRHAGRLSEPAVQLRGHLELEPRQARVQVWRGLAFSALDGYYSCSLIRRPPTATSAGRLQRALFANLAQLDIPGNHGDSVRDESGPGRESLSSRLPETWRATWPTCMTNSVGSIINAVLGRKF